MTINRFPREEVLYANGEAGCFSMNDVYDGLEKLAANKRIKPTCMVLLCRWFGLETVNQFMAKQILSQLHAGKEVHIRFPRRSL
jgi:hypothetical protein